MNVEEAWDKLKKLKAVVDRERISCGEDVWQRDSIGQKFPELLEEMCDIIGYYKEAD